MDLHISLPVLAAGIGQRAQWQQIRLLHFNRALSGPQSNTNKKRPANGDVHAALATSISRRMRLLSVFALGTAAVALAVTAFLVANDGQNAKAGEQSDLDGDPSLQVQPGRFTNDIDSLPPESLMFRKFRVVKVTDTSKTCREILLAPTSQGRLRDMLNTLRLSTVSGSNNSLMEEDSSKASSNTSAQFAESASTSTTKISGDISRAIMENPLVYVFVKQPQLQIQRPYTPLLPSLRMYDTTDTVKSDSEKLKDEQSTVAADHVVVPVATPAFASSVSSAGPVVPSARAIDPGLGPDIASDIPSDSIRLIVRRYEDGEVSQWLHRLRENDIIEVRGPLKHWQYDPSRWNSITFVVGGTGVTPALQLLRSALAASYPKFKRGPEDASVVKSLQSQNRVVSSLAVNSKSQVENGHSQVGTDTSQVERGSFQMGNHNSQCAFQVIYACRSLNECVELEELRELGRRFPEKVKIDVFPDEGFELQNDTIAAQHVHDIAAEATATAVAKNDSNQKSFWHWFRRSPAKSSIPASTAAQTQAQADDSSAMSIETDKVKDRARIHNEALTVHDGPLMTADMFDLVPPEKRFDDGHIALVCGPDGFVRFIAGEPGFGIGDQGKRGGLLVDAKNVFKL